MVDERDGAWKYFVYPFLNCPRKPPEYVNSWIPTENDEVRSVADRRKHTSEAGSASAMEKLEAYLKLAEYSSEAVQKMSNLLKLNSEQCGYLADKLKVVIGRAKLFLEVLRAKLDGALSFVVSIGLSEISFDFLVAKAKQVESYVQGCCKDEWIRAAILSSTIVPNYVSSLGCDLEICRLVFSNDYTATGSRSSVYEAEVEVVEKKALADAKTLIEKVTLELNSLHVPNRDLVIYLLLRLLRLESKIVRRKGCIYKAAFNNASSQDGICLCKELGLVSIQSMGHFDNAIRLWKASTMSCVLPNKLFHDHLKSHWGLPKCVFNKQACISPWIQFGVCAFFLAGLPSFGILKLLTVFQIKPLEGGCGNCTTNCGIDTIDILQPIYLKDCEGLQDCSGCLFAFKLLLPLNESGGYVSVHETHQVFGSGIGMWGYTMKWFTTPKLQGHASKCEVDECDGALALEDMALTIFLPASWTASGEWYPEGDFGKCLQSYQGQADTFGQLWDDANPCGVSCSVDTPDGASVTRLKEPVSASQPRPTPVALNGQSSLSRSQTSSKKCFWIFRGQILGQSCFGMSMNIFERSPHQELTEAQKCELLEKILVLDFLKVKNKKVKKLLTTIQDCQIVKSVAIIQEVGESHGVTNIASMANVGNIAHDATNADSKLTSFDPKCDDRVLEKAASFCPEFINDGSRTNVECMTEEDVGHGGSMANDVSEVLNDVQFSSSALEDMKSRVQFHYISAREGANVSSLSDGKTQALQFSKRKSSECSLDQEVSSSELRRRPRVPKWSVMEKQAYLKLKVEGLRVVEGTDWGFISQRLWERHRFSRTQKSCEDQWGTLLKQFNTIQSYESSKSDHQQWVSYWVMNDDQRFRNKLPKVFHFEWFVMMEDILAVKKKLLQRKKRRGVPAQKCLGDEECSHPHPAYCIVTGSVTGLKKLKSSTFETPVSSTLQVLMQDLQDRLLAQLQEENKQALQSVLSTLQHSIQELQGKS